MPWGVLPVSEIRLAFVHHVESLHVSVSEACRKFGISRKTGHKWLDRYRRQPQQPLDDRSRRPKHSPEQTAAAVEQAVLGVRDRFGWGPRKIHAFLTAENAQADAPLPLPSIRTIGNILRRRGYIDREAALAAPPQFFQRATPHELWQCDHKGFIEVERRKVYPFTVIDDHSRYLLALRPCEDVTMLTAFAVLWDVFGEFGLPQSLLCDNAFGTNFQVPKTLSWFDAQLVRLGIQPLHGKPYHPQTQGKVERLHGTLEREVWPHVRRDALSHFHEDIERWRTEVYNPLRPHESLGDRPPLSRFQPNPRRRPDHMPPAEYPPGAVLRKVSSGGDISWKNCRIRAGAGLTGEWVRIEEHETEVKLYYCWKEIRSLARDQLVGHTVL